MWCADNVGNSVKTVICPRRPLTPSTAPGRARAARGQQRGTIYWQTGRVCLQPGGLLCGSRPPPQLKGWRSGWTPPARTRRAKGNGHRTLPALNIPSGAWGGVRGGAEFYLMLCHQFAMDLNQARCDRWPSALAVVMVWEKAGGGVAAWAERRGGTLADWGCSTGFQRPNQSPGLPNPLLVSPVRRPLSVCVVACAFSRIRYCSVLRTNIIS